MTTNHRNATAEQVAEVHRHLAEAVQALREHWQQQQESREASNLQHAGDLGPRVARRREIEAAITQALKDNDGRLKRGRLVRLMQAAGFTAAPVYRTLMVMSEDGLVIQAGDVLVLQP